jgi:hypothetical protein
VSNIKINYFIFKILKNKKREKKRKNTTLRKSASISKGVFRN